MAIRDKGLEMRICPNATFCLLEWAVLVRSGYLALRGGARTQHSCLALEKSPTRVLTRAGPT